MVVSDEVTGNLFEAAQYQRPVAGLTHDFYHYPARFSPALAREIIASFTKPGDIVLDPFMGGGTTLVEASAMGRNAFGSDISSLAVFLSKVKTTPLSEGELSRIRQWLNVVLYSVNLHEEVDRPLDWIELGYQKYISGKKSWPIRKFLELALPQVESLPLDRQRQFARCLLLRTAQWALDCRQEVPGISLFKQQLSLYLNDMIRGMNEYSSAILQYQSQSEPCWSVCLHASAEKIDHDRQMQGNLRPALILTSPPYPGVHVLYHRWQVRGRKETPAPFWIANCLDSKGEAYYTLGSRKQKHLQNYFNQLEKSWLSILRLIDNRTLIVQVLAFSDLPWQLERYLSTMKDIGLVEIKLSSMPNSPDGRLWRNVPNRKWYANMRGDSSSSQEVVLFHRME
ncbi:MAG TPA: site-specific DNA-methyltransferase [Spirochaetia bacterium]|nr:site-specific DNA-methyltransferase [Spirochaetia bacterium]